MVDQNVSKLASSATQQNTFTTTTSVPRKYIYTRAQNPLVHSHIISVVLLLSHFDLSLFDDEDACEGGDGDKADGDVQGCD